MKIQKNNQKTYLIQSRHRRNRWLSAMTVILFAVLGVVAAVACYGVSITIRAQLDIRPEKYAKKGSLTLMSEEPREVKAGDFRVMLNQLPTMEGGSRDCNIKFENPVENHYSARISLYLKETGNLLGNTRRVDPGKYVEFLHLKKELSVGEYPVRANLELFEGELPAGTMSLDMVLRVTEKGNSADDSQETGNIGTGTQENDSTVDNERKERQDEGE